MAWVTIGCKLKNTLAGLQKYWKNQKILLDEVYLQEISLMTCFDLTNRSVIIYISDWAPFGNQLLKVKLNISSKPFLCLNHKISAQ